MLEFFSANVLSVIFVFGTVVIIHEFGHFLVAKLLRIKVEVFGVGFGPRLFGFRKGETDYRVCAVPLGGYVKMAGENPGDDITGSIEEFLSRPKWQRFLVAVMGPIMNICLAVFLLAGLFHHKFEIPAWLEEPVVVGIIDNNSPAEKAGLLPGDQINEAGQKKDPTWEQFSIAVATSAGQPLELQVLRGGQKIPVTVVPEPQGRQRIGYLGISPFDPSELIVKSVLKGKPAALAGIQPGDKITKIGDVDLEKAGKDLRDALQHTSTEVIPITVLRQGKTLTLDVRPYFDKTANSWMIGIERSHSPKMKVRNLTIGQAFTESAKTNIKFTGLIFEILHKLLKREVSVRMLEGPVGIARQSGMAAKSGFSDLLYLMAAISLNLGIFNLLPIPILDGGVITLILIEALIRRNLSLKLRERITQVGFALLILLAAIVTYNDIVRALPTSVEKYLP
ncbi:MAG TPA: RIP metalloprotease RseP [Terriglobia bacterium]|nr:RIP metalloprotease RseP [Terriglobia bacterium]